MDNNFYWKMWLDSNQVHLEDKEKIYSWSSAKRKLHFQEIVQFSTGFRAPITLGTNFFNQYTVKIITLALAQLFCQEQVSQKIIKIAIFRDHRQESLQTSHLIAKILQDSEIKPYFFAKNQPVPTPFLSFVLKHSHQFQVGIMITASHSAKEINGIKLFNANGHPWTLQENKKINDLIQTKYEQFLNQKIKPLQGTVTEITNDWKEKYLTTILNSISKKLNSGLSRQNKIKILYSSLHGVGFHWTDVLLKKAHYNLVLVEKQCQISADFDTIEEPNPEKDVNFQLAQDLAKKEKPHLIILNDGDADRMRVACYHKNNWQILSGNEVATIFVYFLLHEKGQKGVIYRSFVSTPIVDLIAKEFGCQVIKTVTGFGNLSAEYQKNNPSNFVLAFEESIGYLIDLSINSDKDGLQAALLIAEITTFCQKKKITLFNYLEQIYQKYVYFYSQNRNYFLKQNQVFLQQFQSLKVSSFVADFQVQKSSFSPLFQNQNFSSLFFLNFDKGCSVAIRNSQTEPVGKIYFFAQGPKLSVKKNLQHLILAFEKELELKMTPLNKLK